MNGAYLDSLGWAYFKMGEYELAEENLRQAVERDQTDPTVHDHLGDLYEKTGRIRLAAAQWELSLSEYSPVCNRRRGAGRRSQGAAQARNRPGETGQAGKRHRSGQARIISIPIMQGGIHRFRPFSCPDLQFYSFTDVGGRGCPSRLELYFASH